MSKYMIHTCTNTYKITTTESLVPYLSEVFHIKQVKRLEKIGFTQSKYLGTCLKERPNVFHAQELERERQNMDISKQFCQKTFQKSELAM